MTLIYWKSNGVNKAAVVKLDLADALEFIADRKSAAEHIKSVSGFVVDGAVLVEVDGGRGNEKSV